MFSRNKRHLIALMLFLGFLSSCNAHTHSTQTKSSPLLPLAQHDKTVRLDDGHVKEAMRDYLAYKNAPPYSQYDFMKKDLNNDGLHDAIVYFKTPYGQWCDMHGCTLLILRGYPDGFSVLGEIESVRPPFHISKSKTAGWQDIGVYVSGKQESAHMALLSFDGKQYTMRHANGSYKLHQSFIETSIFP